MMNGRNLLRVACVCLVALGTIGTTVASAADNKTRYMLEGISTPEVFAALIKKPEDRTANAKRLMAAAGCELIDYYIGVHNYKGYIVIECDADADLAALQLVTIAGGGVSVAEATEILTGAELAERAKAAGELVGSYTVPE